MHNLQIMCRIPVVWGESPGEATRRNYAATVSHKSIVLTAKKITNKQQKAFVAG